MTARQVDRCCYEEAAHVDRLDSHVDSTRSIVLEGRLLSRTASLYLKAIRDLQSFPLEQVAPIRWHHAGRGSLAGMQYQAAMSAVPCRLALTWLSLARLECQLAPNGRTHTIHMRLSALSLRHDLLISLAKEACGTPDGPMSIMMYSDAYEHSLLEPRESRSTCNQPCRRRGVCNSKDRRGHIRMAYSMLMLQLTVHFMFSDAKGRRKSSLCTSKQHKAGHILFKCGVLCCSMAAAQQQSTPATATKPAPPHKHPNDRMLEVCRPIALHMVYNAPAASLAAQGGLLAYH